MFTVTVNAAEAIQLLVNVVREHGKDHVAGGTDNGGMGCTYLVESLHSNGVTTKLVPVCIVAQVFSDLGILRALVDNQGGVEGICIPNSLIWARSEAMGVLFDDDARMVLLTVQAFQDGRGAEALGAEGFKEEGMQPWGEALRLGVKAFKAAKVAEYAEKVLPAWVEGEVFSATQSDSDAALDALRKKLTGE